MPFGALAVMVWGGDGGRVTGGGGWDGDGERGLGAGGWGRWLASLRSGWFGLTRFRRVCRFGRAL